MQMKQLNVEHFSDEHINKLYCVEILSFNEKILYVGKITKIFKRFNIAFLDVIWTDQCDSDEKDFTILISNCDDIKEIEHISEITALVI